MKPDDEQRGREAPDDEVERLLADAGVFERSLLAESRRSEDAPGAARIRATLEREWSAERRASRLRYFLAAAAALVLALGAWWAFARDDADRGPAGVHVGQQALEIVAPDGEVERFDVIRWRTTSRSADLRYHLRVVDADTGVELFARRDLLGTELSLQDVATDAWRNIEIELEERSADDTESQVVRVSVRHSPH
jgi:hypothetical protein